MPSKQNVRPLVVFTIGHSTRPLADFLKILNVFGVKQLADIRTMPRSRHNPQYNQEKLAGELRDADIRYIHIDALGGLRHARRDSMNLGWRNASFRGYADYMQQPEFEKAVARLIKLAEAYPTAIMCAEAVPWRCHRSLVADALSVRGVWVMHIMGPKVAHKHSLTPFASVKGVRIAYPRPEDDKGQLLLQE